jgi:hypothetical protein
MMPSLRQLVLCAGIIAALSLTFALTSPALSTSEALQCEELDQLGCMQEPTCAYAGLRCEITDDACEIAWDELAGTEAQCETLAGCTYEARENCYCPPEVDCDCGGGAPQRCLSGE